MGRRTQTIKMKIQQGVSTRFQPQRFKQLKAGIEAGQKMRFEQTFGVLARGIGINHNPAADTQPPPLYPVFLMNIKGANRYIETAIAPRRDPAQCAGV